MIDETTRSSSPAATLKERVETIGSVILMSAIWIAFGALLFALFNRIAPDWFDEIAGKATGLFRGELTLAELFDVDIDVSPGEFLVFGTLFPLWMAMPIQIYRYLRRPPEKRMARKLLIVSALDSFALGSGSERFSSDRATFHPVPRSMEGL